MKQINIPGKFKQLFATVCLGPISFGASMAWTSPVLPVMLDRNSTSSLHLTTEESSWVGSMLAVGALISAVPTGILADRFGPKKCSIALTLPTIAFALIVIFTNDVYSLCIARVLSGIAIGGISVVSPMYMCEISEVSIRCALGIFFTLLIAFGVIIVNVCGAFVHYVTLTIILGLIAFVSGISFLFLPESPTYLVKIHKEEQGARALTFYRHFNYDSTKDLEDINKCIQHKMQIQCSNVRKLLSSKGSVRALIASAGLTVFQELTAVDIITYYGVQIFEASDSGIDAYMSLMIIFVVSMLSSLVMIFIIEKAGRKLFLYISSLGVSVCLTLLGLYFHLKCNDIYFVGMNFLPLVILIFYFVTLTLGFGQILWSINGELFSPEIKGVASGMTVLITWSMQFITTKSFPILAETWGYHCIYYTYSSFMIAAVIFIKFCVPETQGKTLEQIQRELNF